MYQATFEAQFMKKLRKNEAELKKSVAYKKRAFLKCSFKPIAYVVWHV